jgi:integrase
MSVYFVKGKGYRYDFTLRGIRSTEAWFKTKIKAKQAEAKRREELKNPKLRETTQTDMDFLTLANKRLDYVKSYDSESHFKDVLYHVRRWVKEWDGLICTDISNDMIERYIIKRSGVSACVANKELQYLRALFNYGIKRKLIIGNPTDDIEFLPVEIKKKYVPSKDDVLKVISVADPDTQQYLWTILLTGGRVGEINGLSWEDVNFTERYVTLWTRKRKGGNREPRDVPMVQKLYDILWHRFERRNTDMPWVYWHTYWSRKLGQNIQGRYNDRKKIMKSLCNEARVKYFRFHPFRHLTASILDDLGVPIGVIQRILGHQNRRTTEIYLHSVGEAEREAMKKLESVDFFGAISQPDKASPINTHTTYWQRKVKRPSYDKLKRDVELMGYVGTGKKYGVSDNSIRKWLKFYKNQPQNLN